MCCWRLAANTERKKVAKNRYLGTIAQLRRAISFKLCNEGTYRQSGKNLLSSNMSSTCSHNMVNFGPIAAEILSLVWGRGSPANFNGFRVLSSVTARHLVVGVSQTLRRWTEGATAGRPSRWASAHILVYSISVYVLGLSACSQMSTRALTGSSVRNCCCILVRIYPLSFRAVG